jgi:hypothetical protein
MTNQEAQAYITSKAAELADAGYDKSRVDDMVVALMFFANPEFRATVSDMVWNETNV